MPAIHIGHHFFGAGNAGDDFMLAGFLAALGGRASRATFTCCVPHPREPLARRFPDVGWRPYDEGERRRSVAACDAWLGLGGSPFQSAVSPWFAEHLETETRLCAEAGKPMYFLGVGGQDRAAYGLRGLRDAASRAERIWTRDGATAAALAGVAGKGRVREAADLAHLFFASAPPPRAEPGRLTAALNVDYGDWSGLDKAVAALGAVPARERVWLAQEIRPLPGAEQWLFARLPASERARWRLHLADASEGPFRAPPRDWPSGQWLLTSRYHTALAGAWAGSRAVVVAVNDKLRAAAGECGYPAIEPDADPAGLAGALMGAAPPAPPILRLRATAARAACEEFFSLVGI